MKKGSIALVLTLNLYMFTQMKEALGLNLSLL